MPLHDTSAFVLRSFTFHEADKICVFFTRDAGKLRGVAHGARKLKSRYGASLEPFTEVSLVYFQKENKELVSISNCEILRSQFVAGLSSEMLGVLHYLAELVIEFLPDHEPNERVYRLIAATLGALKESPNDKLPLLVRYFEVWMLKLAGFFPDWKHCGACRRDLARESSVWLTGEGMPQCSDCSGRRGEELTPGGWRAIRDILTMSPAKFVSSYGNEGSDERSIQLAGIVATRLIARVLERDLKSYEVLDRLKPILAGS
jgi:DNA repair protein RecO (recombination protein O)